MLSLDKYDNARYKPSISKLFVRCFIIMIDKIEQLLRHAQVVGVWYILVGVFYADVVVHVVIVELMTDAIFRS